MFYRLERMLYCLWKYVCSNYGTLSCVGWMGCSFLYSWSSCAPLYVGLASRDACVLPFPVS